MQNVHASDGIGEDLLRAITNFACSEAHAKTLYEKVNAELENGLVDVEDEKVLQSRLDEMGALREDINNYAELRRKTMLALYEQYGSKGDKNMWCMVKHLSVSTMTLFEAYQASDDDLGLLQLAIDSNKQFVKAVSRFVGADMTECASCLSDYLKAKE